MKDTKKSYSMYTFHSSEVYWEVYHLEQNQYFSVVMFIIVPYTEKKKMNTLIAFITIECNEIKY